MGRGAVTITERAGKRGSSLIATFYATPAGERRPQRVRLTVPHHLSRSAAVRWAEGERRRIELEGMGPTTRAGREKAKREAAEIATREAAERAAAISVAEVWPLWLAACEAARQSPKTIEAKRTSGLYIVATLGERRVRDVCELDVTRLKRSLDKLRASTLKLVLQHLRTALSWAHTALGAPAPGELRLKDVKVSRGEPRVYDLETFERLVAAASQISLQHLGAVLLGGEAALRRGEIAGVRVEDIDEKARVLHVRRQVVNVSGTRVVRPTKGGRPRMVPLTPRLLAVLAELVKATPEDGWVMRTQIDQAPATQGSIDVLFRAPMKVAGLKVEGAHILRHSALSHMLTAGVDLETVREIAGHHSIAVTAIYLHRTTALQGAADKLAAMRQTDANLTQAPTARRAPVLSIAGK